MFFHQIAIFVRSMSYYSSYGTCKTSFTYRKGFSAGLTQFKYPALSLLDAFPSEAGTYPRAKVYSQISLYSLCVQT